MQGEGPRCNVVARCAGQAMADPAAKWPAVLEMHGYAESTMPQPPAGFGDRYVTVRASVRGASASGGVMMARLILPPLWLEWRLVQRAERPHEEGRHAGCGAEGAM